MSSSLYVLHCRYDETNVCIEDAGWHCTWCFPSLRELARKMQRYSHYDVYASLSKSETESLMVKTLLPKGWRLEDYVEKKESKHVTDRHWGVHKIAAHVTKNVGVDLPSFFHSEDTKDRLQYLKHSKKAEHPETVPDPDPYTDWASKND